MSDALPLPPHPVSEQYEALARDLRAACEAGEPGAIRDWAARWLETLVQLQRIETTPDVRDGIRREVGRIARRWENFRTTHDGDSRCLLADAQTFLAREHGFLSWLEFVSHIESLAQPGSPVRAFEAATDAIVDGDIAGLRRLLQQHPGLVRARSTREHRSTLLHYVSANGVEDFRQRTPPNIVEITALLLDAGADVNAESDAYGGGSTTLGLVATSVHPEEAGVQIALLELLLDRGAYLDKPGLTGNRHSAIKGCLANGQGGAAEFFANRGAPMDLEEAAGVGRLEVVARYLDEHGVPTSGATREQLESGFMYACGYGHTEVVRYLLEKGFDPAFRNHENQTGLHWAASGPHVDILRMLLDRDAPVNVRETVFGGTPLDWALYGWGGGPATRRRDEYCDAVRLLVQAGATLEPDWSERNDDWRRIADRVRSHPQMRDALRGSAPREPDAL